MEYLDKGELWESLTIGDHIPIGISEDQAVFYIADIVLGLQYLRSQGIVHRDLKPENCVLGSNGHLKIIDFGTAKDLIDKSLNGPNFVGNFLPFHEILIYS